MKLPIAFVAAVLPVLAGDLVLPSLHLERTGPVTFIYRLSSQATGKGELSVRWTDALGRIVEDDRKPFELIDETEIGFTLDLRRALTTANDLAVHLKFDGVSRKGAADHREEEASARFVATPSEERWRDYEIMMWQNYPAQAFPKLKEFGITGSQMNGRSMRLPEFLTANNLRWYVEGIGNDYYAEYHRFHPDRIQNWSWSQAKELYRKDPSSKEAFKRMPSFSDPAWREKIRRRFADVARLHSPYRPFFYSLADEGGIADLAGFWDFDFSDFSLTEMRDWLKQRYETLAALNAQWGTAFDNWNAINPQTTTDAMKRTDGNYSSWSDFKEWMDVAYARALAVGVDAVHSVDPRAYVGMGGGQMPGWGGYDYWRISRVLSAIEPYNIGNNIGMLRSFNPEIVVLTTAFATGPWEKQRVWSELLRGGRGLILWDDKNEFLTKDGETGPRGTEMAPYYNELRDGIGALLINSRREADPVAIHYSQASMRVEWMLANRTKGDAWLTRTSHTEYTDSEFLTLRESYCRLIEDLGLQYKFVASPQVENGELQRAGYKILILPHSSALSAKEAGEIREFAREGGLVLADGAVGEYDERARKLERSQLSGTRISNVPQGSARYYQDRLVGKEGPFQESMRKTFTEAGVRPEFRVVDASGAAPTGIETHTFRNGAATILAVHSNPQLRVNELGPPEFKSNDRFAKTRRIRVTLPAPRFVYDIRKRMSLGMKTTLEADLDPYEPTMLAMLPGEAPKLVLAAPEHAVRGEVASFGIHFAGSAAPFTSIFHVEVSGAEARKIVDYSGNVIADANTARKTIPIALSDAPGHWKVRVRDVLTGQEKTASLDVK